MRTTIKATILENPDIQETLDYEPETTCPHCHVAVKADALSAYTVNSKDYNGYRSLFVTHFCSNCEQCFLSLYMAECTVVLDNRYYQHQRTFPFNSAKKDFSVYVGLVSPHFIRIYNEALHAERMGLYQVCGIGYRKALEFLVKDYFRKSLPDEADAIIKKPLAECIQRFTDDDIRGIARCCAKLGNDETHYLRKYGQSDIDFLKALLDQVASFIHRKGLYIHSMDKLAQQQESDSL